MSSSLPPSDQPDPKLTDWLREHRASGEPTVDVDAAWTRFQERHAVRPISTARPRSRRPVFIAALTTAIAAAAAFLLIGRPAARQSNATMTTHVAALGARDTVTLDDGSRITLNAGSRLRVLAGPGDKDVYLEGEAFFEITHDPRRAFRVHAANGIVEDIGTKFTVRALASHRSVEVAVTEGKVALGADSTRTGALQLSAGDAAMIDSAGAVAKLPPEALDRLVGWTTGALVFDNATLGDAAAEIERRYNVRVIIADASLAKRPVVARFHGEPVTQVLDAIALALGAHYDASGTTYTLGRGSK